MKTLVGTVLGIHRWPASGDGSPARNGIHLQITHELLSGTDLIPLGSDTVDTLLPGTGVAIVMAPLSSDGSQAHE